MLKFGYDVSADQYKIRNLRDLSAYPKKSCDSVCPEIHLCILLFCDVHRTQILISIKIWWLSFQINELFSYIFTDHIWIDYVNM